MANDKVRVFVVDDSSVFVKFLTEGLAAENPRIEIVGYAMNASDAMRKIPSARPDVVTMDIEMPKTNGIEFLKELLPTYLVPVILVSSVNVSVFDALAETTAPNFSSPIWPTRSSAPRQQGYSCRARCVTRTLHRSQPRRADAHLQALATQQAAHLLRALAAV